ncbi:MAG: PUA domain-containing protein [Halobacteriales archaeon]
MSDATVDELSPAERDDLRAVARYQFGAGAGDALIGAADGATRRRSGRVDRLYAGPERVATLTTAGRFTLGLAGGRALREAGAAPAWRVTVDAEAAPFVAGGETAFAKFVERVDPQTRPRDEVLVVDAEDELLAVGRAALSASAMVAFDRGVAVDVREGVETG